MKFEIKKTITEKKELNVELVNTFGCISVRVNGVYIFDILKNGKCSLVRHAYNCGLETDKEGKVILVD